MIRKYKEEDLEAIVAIGNDAWQKIFNKYREIFGDELFEILITNPESKKGLQIENHCRKYPQQIFVVEKNEKIVGFITFFINKEKMIGEIGNNAVAIDFTGQGIGQKMYKHVLQHFKEQGMKFAKVSTGCDDAHLPARKAYVKAGFNIENSSIDFYKKLSQIKEIKKEEFNAMDANDAKTQGKKRRIFSHEATVLICKHKMRIGFCSATGKRIGFWFTSKLCGLYRIDK